MQLPSLEGYLGPDIPDCIALTRAGVRAIEILPVKLPTPLDLRSVLTAVCEEAAYDLSLDSSQPPPRNGCKIDSDNYKIQS